MMIKLNERLERLILASAFVSLTIAVLISWSSPATGYELSIYNSTPIFFWIFFGYSVLASVILLLNIIFSKQKITFINKISFGLILLNGFVITSLHIIRGYLLFDMDGDVGTHIGYLNELIQQGFIDIHYPAMYIETAMSHLLSNMDVISLVKYNSAIYFIILVLGIYVLARYICEKKSEIYFITFIASLYPFGSAMYLASSSQAMYAPYIIAIFTMPLFMAIVFKLISTNKIQKSLLILACILSLSILVTHILTATFALIFLLCILAQQIYLRLRMHAKINIKSVAITFLVFLAMYSLWIGLITSIMRIPVSSFYDILFTGDVDTMGLTLLNTRTSSVLDDPLFEILRLIFLHYGTIIILFVVTLFIIPTIYKKIMVRNQYHNYISLSLLVFTMLGFAILPIISSSVSYETGRPMFLVVLVGILYAGICFSKMIFTTQLRPLNNTSIPKLIQFIGIGLLITLIILSIGSIYASDDRNQSTQTTLAFTGGAYYYLTHNNPDFDLISVGSFTPSRFAMVLRHSLYVRNGVYEHTYKPIEYANPAPEHFDYQTSLTSFGNSVSKRTYLLIIESYIGYMKHRGENKPWMYQPFTDNDYGHLKADNTVNKIFTNPDFTIYYVMDKK